MFHPLSLWVGLRYLRSKRRSGFVSFVSLVSILGIGLGVTALIVVISVMNGFERELTARTLSMVAHATIADLSGQLEGWPDAVARAQAHPQVAGAAPYIEREVLLRGRAVSGAMIRGVLPDAEATVSELGGKMKAGTLGALKAGEFGAVLGTELAWRMGLEVGDKFTVFAPEFTASPVGALPQVKRFTVVGLFEVGMFEYDNGMLLTHLSDAQRLFRMGDAVSGVRLKLKDMFKAYTVARELAAELGGGYSVRDWQRMHVNLFRAVKTEKFTMFVILSLVVAIAAFNLVSSLVMTVNEKRADIAILRTLGAAPGMIQRIFMVQGMVAGILGTLFGVACGVLLALNLQTVIMPWLERVFNFEAMPGDIYYINQLPSELRLSDVLTITAVSLLFSLVSTLYPSWRAARMQPAEALRYE